MRLGSQESPFVSFIPSVSTGPKLGALRLVVCIQTTIHPIQEPHRRKQGTSIQLASLRCSHNAISCPDPVPLLTPARPPPFIPTTNPVHPHPTTMTTPSTPHSPVNGPTTPSPPGNLPTTLSCVFPRTATITSMRDVGIRGGG